LKWLVLISISNKPHTSCRTLHSITYFYKHKSYTSCKCKLLVVVYVRKVVHALSDCCLDLPVFNVAKLFNPCHYPSNESDRITNINYGSEGDCWSFNILHKEVTCVRKNIWNLWKHFDMSVRTKWYYEAWCVCGRNLEWHTNWPKLM
jgi:hypothetical protein